MAEPGTRLGDFSGPDVQFLDGPGSPLLRVSSLVAAVARRRRIWLATGLAGLVVASAYFVLRGSPYAASTTVLLRRPTINAQDPARAMATDLELGQSRTLAGRVLSQLQLAEPISHFQSEFKASKVTDDVLQLTAKAATAAEATRRADTLAKAFLDFRAQNLQRETQVEISALQQQSNTLRDQLRPLNDQINIATLEAGPSGPPAATNSLSDLLAHRAQINGEIATVQQRISDITADSAAVVENSRVIDPALASRRSTKRAVVIDLMAGLLGGLAIGIGWVVVSEAATNRVRRREDVMAALDAPVMVSVGPLDARPRRIRWRSARSSQPPAPPTASSPRRNGRDTAKVVRHLREVLATTQSATPALAVVSVDSDRAAGLVVAATVQGLLGEGNDVLAIDLSQSSALARVFGVDAHTVSEVEQSGYDAKLWVVSRSLAVDSTIDDWMQLHNLGDEADAVVVLATLDPADGGAPLAALVTTAVAIVTSGRSTAATLRATGQMLRAAGLRLDSTVLVGADTRDESFGVGPTAARAPAWA